MKQIYFTFIAIVILNFGCKKEDSATSPEDSKEGGSISYNGFTYHTVSIGTQEWTVENLRTTSYNDGTPILNLTDSTEWLLSSTGAYCVYANNETNVKSHGLLYNFYAVKTGKLSPITGGWHVPTHADWTKLTNYLGGEDSAGTKLKAKSGWNNSGNGTDSYGFNALPSGNRSNGGFFYGVGDNSHWWSSTAYGTNAAYVRGMSDIYTSVYSYDYFNNYGFYVRLVRDK